MQMFRWAVVVWCARRSAPARPPSQAARDSIARLEQARANDPKSESALRSLGIAYFKANRLPEARTALSRRWR